MTDNHQAQQIIDEYKERERKKLSRKMSRLAKRALTAMTPEARRERAKKASDARWKK